jgi:hypothetical protein
MTQSRTIEHHFCVGIFKRDAAALAANGFRIPPARTQQSAAAEKHFNRSQNQPINL